MRREMYSRREFISNIKNAADFYDQGKERKAFSILRKSLSRYDGKIPAYYYMKYKTIFDDFYKEYDVEYSIESMKDQELHSRISEALRKNRVDVKRGINFKKESRGLLDMYLRDAISIDGLKNRLQALENELLTNGVHTAQFCREIRTIFGAYFWDRKTIARNIVNKYEKLLKTYYDCYTLEEIREEKDTQIELNQKKWPKEIKCAVRINSKGDSWKRFYLDPTLFDKIELKDKPRNEEEGNLILISSMISFATDKNGEYVYRGGCRIIKNWFDLEEKYPELMEKLIKYGERYYHARQSHLSNYISKVKQRSLAIPDFERKKVVKIWDDKKWVEVKE